MTEPRDPNDPQDDRLDDLLAQATRSLRETAAPSDQELADGRAVLLWAQRVQNRKNPTRGRALRWVLPLAAVLTAGTALAATSGQLEWVSQAVDRCVEAVRVGEPKPKRAKVQRKPQAQSAAVAVGTPTDVPPNEPAQAETPDAAVAPAPVRPVVATPETAETKPAKSVGVWKPKPRATSRDALDKAEEIAASAPLPPPALEEPAPGPVPSADLAAYRKAHGLHFRNRDFRSALAAWDAYLAEQPQGTFALEALYNRAICLLRLGRTEEAKQALSPFAQGAMQNHYRQTEATELLEALE
ncbi:MAG: hypothetical protein ABW252_20020 [Polyangiales bacterium]